MKKRPPARRSRATFGPDEEARPGELGGGWIRHLEIEADAPARAEFPFSIPALQHLEQLDLHPAVTFFVGENGSGKSTLLEAIATKLGFNPEGGNHSHRFASQGPPESGLSDYLRLARRAGRWSDSWYLRAESFYNFSTYLSEHGVSNFGPEGRQSLHQQSHGEAFLSVLLERMFGHGLYLFDEPEAALSPTRQLALLVHLDRLVRAHSQCIIATHSPILLAYPHARILHFGPDGILPIRYEETEHFRVTRDFLNRHEMMLARLLRDEDEPADP